MGEYRCHGCDRLVDRDLEPSPGEPFLCGDCWMHREREEQITRDWYADDDPEAVA